MSDRLEEVKRTISPILRQFMASQQLQDSVIRRIEIIGEATKNLPQFHF